MPRVRVRSAEGYRLANWTPLRFAHHHTLVSGPTESPLLRALGETNEQTPRDPLSATARAIGKQSVLRRNGGHLWPATGLHDLNVLLERIVFSWCVKRET